MKKKQNNKKRKRYDNTRTLDMIDFMIGSLRSVSGIEEKPLNNDFNIEVFTYLYLQAIQERSDNQNRIPQESKRFLDMISYVRKESR